MSSEGPVVEEVRRRAMELSERYGHDLRRYGEHLKEIEEEHRALVVDQVTVVRSPPRATPGQ